jgi:uncharacterized protein YoxC
VDSKGNDMENLKLPITVIGVVILQIGGFIWWTAQQAATIADLEETVSQLSSRMAIEETVNLKRDVQLNAEHIDALKDAVVDEVDDLWYDVDDLWDEVNNMANHMTSIMKLQQRMAVLENTLQLTGRLNGKDGM